MVADLGMMYWAKAKRDSKAQLVSIKVRSEERTQLWTSNRGNSPHKRKLSLPGAGAAGLLLKAVRSLGPMTTSQQSNSQSLTGPHHPGLREDSAQSCGLLTPRKSEDSLGFLEETASEQEGRCFLQDHFSLPSLSSKYPEEMHLKEMSQSTQQAVHYHR